MFNLLKVEFYKLKKFQFGYIAVLFMFVMGYLCGDNRIGNKIFDSTDNTARAFLFVSDTSLVFLISIVMALFIGRDFSNRTICNEIKMGYSRFHILFSRTIVVCVFAALLHTVYVISIILGFSVVRGFDASVLRIENVLWLLTVLIQLMAVISGVVLFSFIAKKVSEAIVLSTLYTFICCNVLRNFLDASFFTRSCFCFVQDNSKGSLAFSTISALVTMIIFLAVAVFTFNKAEIE